MQTLSRLNAAASLHLFGDQGSPARGSELAQRLESVAAALGVAAALAGATPVLGQARVVPLLVDNASGPDFGPVPTLISFTVATAEGPDNLALSIQSQMTSATTVDLSLLFGAGPGGLVQIARGNASTGDRFFQSPLTGGVPNARGDISFLEGGSLGAAERINIARIDGGFTTVVQAGQPINPASSSPWFRSFSSPIRFNSAADVLFGASLRRSGLLDSPYDRGLWLSQTSGFAEVSRTGALAPGLSATSHYFFGDSPTGLLGDGGHILFSTSFTAGDPFQPVGKGVWTGTPGSIEIVQATGREPIGTYPPGTIVTDVTACAVDPAGAAYVEEVVTLPTAQTSRTLLRRAAGATTPFLSVGQNLPGVGNLIAFTIAPNQFGNAGDFVFAGSSFTIAQGLIRRGPDGFTLLTRENTMVTADRRLSSNPQFVPRINRTREVITLAQTRRTVNPNLPEFWLFFIDRAGTMRTLLKPGDPVFFPDGSSRPVLSIFTDSLGVPDARGWVTVRVNFTGGIGTLLINPRACDADFDASGTLDPDDLAEFINAFFAPQPDAALVDFNLDGETNADDLADYLNAYFAGC